MLRFDFLINHRNISIEGFQKKQICQKSDVENEYECISFCVV